MNPKTLIRTLNQNLKSIVTNYSKVFYLLTLDLYHYSCTKLQSTELDLSFNMKMSTINVPVSCPKLLSHCRRDHWSQNMEQSRSMALALKMILHHAKQVLYRIYIDKLDKCGFLIMIFLINCTFPIISDMTANHIIHN